MAKYPILPFVFPLQHLNLPTYALALNHPTLFSPANAQNVHHLTVLASSLETKLPRHQDNSQVFQGLHLLSNRPLAQGAGDSPENTY